MFLNVLIVLVCVVAGAILIWPRLSNAPLWRAASTPLASIIGSGFLILGPILAASYGAWSPAIMAALCIVAYLFGGTVRYNIARRDRVGKDRTGIERNLDGAASWALSFAYVISVAYYLNLFGAFAVSLTPYNGHFQANVVTTAVFVLILAVGWIKGFDALERMEQVSVGLKLAIISGLLFALVWYFGRQAAAGELVANRASIGGWEAVAMAFGLIVTVQGFETSRYLGIDYDADTRLRSMRIAQWLSAAIYMVYITAFTYVFPPGSLEIKETAIIDMMSVVAGVLPYLLIAAALGAQFSAAVADTSGAGGLLSEISRRRLRPRVGYAILVAVGIVLTWGLSIFEIISYASRAFALYYAIQAAIAAFGTRAEGRKPWIVAAYGALSVLGIAIAVFGRAVE